LKNHLNLLGRRDHLKWLRKPQAKSLKKRQQKWQNWKPH
jgi:hypothetical protein